MSDIENIGDKVTIHILQCKGLQGSKGNQLTAIAKVEFNNTVLGESSKVETDTGSVLFDFKCDLTVNPLDPLALDELAQTPVVVTLTEILPKDKKSKEEKTNLLGQTCIDLLPLLKGDTSFTIIEQIHPVHNSELTAEHVLADVEISISTTKPLLTDEQLESCNLLTVCVESAFSVPEAWHHNGNQYSFAACMPIPITNEKETVVLIPNGSFRDAGEKEVSDQRKWSCVPNASGSCLYIPNTEIQQVSYEEENGDFKTEEDIEFRIDAENNRPHVTWNAERRSFLGSVSTECLQQKIALHRYWPLEIIRALQPNNIKPRGKEEDSQVSYHGIIYVDLAPLLYPGVRKIRGAYLVHPYNENEAQEKLQRKGILNDDVIKTLVGISGSSSSLGQPKAGGAAKQGKADTKAKPSAAAMKVEGATEEAQDVASQEGQQYIEAKTYIVLELELEKPLVAKREREEIAARVAELIPPRPAFPKKEGGSKKAIQDFENEIYKAADQLLEEFREMFGSEVNSNVKDADQRRKEFLYELNTSGKYFAFKERLKFYVVKIVREKFMYKTNFKTQEEREAFVSKLYIFLLDHMHKGLNKYLSTEEDVEIPPAVADSSMLKHFAKEAEVMFKYDLAAKYYQQRIVQDEFDVECWYDYGIFCLLIGDMQRAEECFKQVVSLDQNHLFGLLMSGLMCSLHEEYTAAEELLDAATCLHPDEILPWTLLGFHYSGVENSIMAEHAFNEANKLLCKKPTDEVHQDDQPKAEISEQMQVKEDEEKNVDEGGSNEHEEVTAERKNATGGDHKSIFLLAAKFLLDSHIWQIAERALAHEVVTRRDELNVPYYETLGLLQIHQKQYDKALNSFKEALVLRHENPNIWANKGHVYYVTQEFQLSQECYERSLAYTMDASDMYVIYIRLATIYLEKENKYTDAKNMFLKACQTSPSCVTWLGVGISCYKLNELEEAEQALNEANILENNNADVWAYLTLVCLKQQRHLEAEQCYKYAVKLGLCDHALEQELKTTMILTDFDDSVL